GSFLWHLLRGHPTAPARAYLDGRHAGHGAAVLGLPNTQRGRPLDAGRGRALPAPFPRLGPAAPPERRSHRHLLERGPGFVVHRLRGERLDVRGARGSAHAHWGAAEDFLVLFW